MTYLLDTNVVSELRKMRPHGAVLAWRHSVPIHQLAIPAIVLAEAQAGIELTRKQNPEKAAGLEAWIDQVQARYTIVSANGPIFREWARLMHGRSANLTADAMIAATARVLGTIVATRNVKDFDRFQVEVFDPFKFNPETAH
ncbi:MAG: type II toxin-antitoxin system VapC family toxin [Terracidiphilus sp.]